MQYEIVATLGPSSESPAIWQAMIAAGATAFRLNTSHLSLEQLAAWLQKIQDFRTETGLTIPLVLDLQGSKWRLGDFPSFELQPGAVLQLVFRKQVDQPHILPVPHADFFRAAQNSNGEIILNDAKSRLEVLSSDPASLTARVVVGGNISAHKGITFGATQFRVEAISEKDSQILNMASQDASMRFAISYVRDSAEMEKYRQMLGSSAYLIAKLERASAMADVARNFGLLRRNVGVPRGPGRRTRAACNGTVCGCIHGTDWRFACSGVDGGSGPGAHDRPSRADPFGSVLSVGCAAARIPRFCAVG